MKNLKNTKLGLIFFAVSLFSFIAINNISVAMEGELGEAFGGMDVEALGKEFSEAAANAEEFVDKAAQEGNEFTSNKNVEQELANAQEGLQSQSAVSPEDSVSFSSGGDSVMSRSISKDSFSDFPPPSPHMTESAGLVQEQTPMQTKAINQTTVETNTPRLNNMSDPVEPVAKTTDAVGDALLKKGQAALDVKSTTADLETANAQLKDASNALKEAKSSGDPDAISTANKNYQDALEQQGKALDAQASAKAALKDAGAQASSANAHNTDSLAKQASELKSQMGSKLENAKSSLEAAQSDLEAFEQTKPNEADYEKNDDNNAWIKANDEYEEGLQSKQAAVEKAQGEVESAQKNYDAASKAAEGKSFAAKAWDFAKGKLEFIAEQLVQSVLFSIVPEIFQQLSQTLQNKALYADITSVKTFAGINMKIPSGLVPSENPLGGLFIYYDVQPGSKITNAYLRDPNRRWFVSYDPTGFAEPGTYYIGASNFPDSMLELSTGLIFDASGSVVYPSYSPSQSMPFTMPTSLLFNDTSTVSNTALWSSSPKMSIEAALNGLTTSVNGSSKSSSYGSLDPVNIFFGGAGSYDTGPDSNSNLKYLFTTPSYYSANLSYPPIMHSTLLQYVTPTENALTNFGQPAVGQVQGVAISLQELAGLGDLAEIFGAAYFNIFINQSSSLSPADSAAYSAKLKNFYEGLAALRYVDPAKVTDPNAQLVGTTLELTNSASLDHLISSLTTATAQNTNGFDPRDHLIAHGLPIYQTDSTPTAQFLKDFVSATSSSVLAKYVHDIVVPLDTNKMPTLAMIPTVTNGSVSFQANPAVQYITSLVSGLTYQQNSGYNMPVQSPNGGADNTIASSILSYISTPSKWPVSILISQQISQIRSLFNTAITEGPFNLSGGLQAYRVSLPAMLNAVVDGVTNQSLVNNWIGNVAEQIPNTASFPDFNQKMALLADAFVYTIPNALQGIASDGVTVISLPDYVVPIMQDLVNKDCYLMVPLGCQASTNSIGFGMPSQQIFGLISLVTSKFYNPDYTLKNDPVADSLKIGNPPSLPTVLGTAFVETDFNPLNFTNTGTKSSPVYTPLSPYIVTIPSLYFLNLNAFSFSFGLLPVQSTSSEAGTSSAGATFITIGGGKPAPLGIPLNMLLPQGFTGIAPNSNSLNSTIPGSSTPSTGVTSYTNAQLVSAESGNLPSVSAVHASWFTYMNSISAGSIMLELDPQYICNNNGYSDWTITATNIADVKNGNYFYTTNQTSGLYVLATYGNGGTTTSVNISGKSVSLSDFSGIGANFSEAASSNALIDVGTGSVLVIVPGSSSSTTTMAPLMRYSVASGTNSPALLAPILLDPQAVTALALKNQQTNAESKAPSAQLLSRIASSQGNSTNTTVMGPYSYAGYSLTVDRQLYNDGNYIYTAKDSTGAIKDYLITYDSSSTQVYNKPFSINSKMVSMLNGRLFSASGVNSSTNGGIFFGINNFDLSKAPETCEGLVVGVSGVQINSITEPTIINDIATLAATVNNEVINQSNIIDDSEAIEDKVFALAQKLHIPYAALNSTQPIASIIGQSVQFNEENGILTGQLVQDTNGQFYLRSAIPTGTSSVNGATLAYSYYQFDISQLPSAKTLDKNKILQMPTGVFYDQNGKATSVLVGNAALKMLSAYGLVIAPSNQLTLGLPIVRQSLPMTVSDYNVESNSSALLNGGNGLLMQRLPGTSVISGSSADYYFYKNIFHAGASAAQLEAAENNAYGAYNDPYSPYDLLLQVNPKVNPQAPSIPAGDPYFASLLTGITYGMDGTQLYENCELYFQNIGNSSSAPASNLPLIVWGDGIANTQAILGSSDISMVDGIQVEGTDFVNFNTYQIDPFGWSFEYVSPSDASNNPVIYTLTYQDPSYYLSAGNPGFSFQAYPPTAVPNSEGEYISQLTDSKGNVTYVIENSDGENTPLIPGQIFKVDSNGALIATYGETAVIPSVSSALSLADNNTAVLSAICNAVAESMYEALTTGRGANNPLPTLGTVYKISTGPNPTVLKSYYLNGTPNAPVFDKSSFSAGDIDVSTDGSFATTIINQGYINLVLANMQAAQAENSTTGTVFVVPSVAGSALPSPLKASYSMQLTTPAGSSAPTLTQIAGAAAQNMINALNDANSAKLAQSRKLMNMTSVIKYGSTLEKILLAQDSLGVYSMYQSNLLTNNGSALATYSLQPSELWKANILSFVGTRPSSAAVGTLPVYDQTNVYNNTVLIENVLTKTYDTIIYDNSVYRPVKPGGALGVGLTSVNTFNILGASAQPIPESTPVTYAPLDFSNTASGLSTNASDYITLNIKNYGDLLNPGKLPPIQYTDSNGNLVNIWPQSMPGLLLNDAKYVSINAPFNATGPQYSNGKFVPNPTEWIFQYVYPLVDQNAIPDLLGSLNIALVGSTSGIITPVMTLPVNNGAIALNSIAASPSDGGQALALAAINSSYSTATTNTTTAQNNLNALIAEVNADATSAVQSAIPQIQTGGTCPAGTMPVSIAGARGPAQTYCVPATALSLVGGTTNANKNTNSNTSGISLNQNKTVSQLQSGVANAQKTLANLQSNLTAVTTPSTGLLASRSASRMAFLNNLYYRTVTSVNESGNSPSTVAILYYKVDANTLSQLSATTNATIGCYIEYPIGTQEAGYIYNGIAPTADQLDLAGKPIPPAIALGEPTGASLSSADMITLKSLVGTTLLLNSSGVPVSALIPDPSQNSIITLTAGNSLFNNYFYFGDLLPGGSAFVAPSVSAPLLGGLSSPSK